ncbi:MAG TPA: hypothetical protein VH062_02300 [Polyangiaceae bacterium]|jgi:hypothetical protein|nr:hypothetical protein [Polyangiaceae bacterium]
MALRRIKGLSSYSVFFVCDAKNHRFELFERNVSPPVWKCTKCGCFGFMLRRGVAFRNGKVKAYRCSTSGCSREAKIRSKVRGNGGLYDYACSADHATGEKFQANAVELAARREQAADRADVRRAT